MFVLEFRELAHDANDRVGKRRTRREFKSVVVPQDVGSNGGWSGTGPHGKVIRNAFEIVDVAPSEDNSPA
jgi:hypothetical protein